MTKIRFAIAYFILFSLVGLGTARAANCPADPPENTICFYKKYGVWNRAQMSGAGMSQGVTGTSATQPRMITQGQPGLRQTTGSRQPQTMTFDDGSTAELRNGTWYQTSAGPSSHGSTANNRVNPGASERPLGVSSASTEDESKESRFIHPSVHNAKEDEEGLQFFALDKEQFSEMAPTGIAYAISGNQDVLLDDGGVLIRDPKDKIFKPAYFDKKTGKLGFRRHEDGKFIPLPENETTELRKNIATWITDKKLDEKNPLAQKFAELQNNSKKQTSQSPVEAQPSIGSDLAEISRRTASISSQLGHNLGKWIASAASSVSRNPSNSVSENLPASPPPSRADSLEARVQALPPANPTDPNPAQVDLGTGWHVTAYKTSTGGTTYSLCRDGECTFGTTQISDLLAKVEALNLLPYLK